MGCGPNCYNVKRMLKPNSWMLLLPCHRYATILPIMSHVHYSVESISTSRGERNIILLFRCITISSCTSAQPKFRVVSLSLYFYRHFGKHHLFCFSKDSLDRSTSNSYRGSSVSMAESSIFDGRAK